MESVAELTFDHKDLEARWDRVREDFWGDLRVQTRRALKGLLERMMEIEVQDLVGAKPWKREPKRRTYRNGCYTRDLLTSLGWITRLEVPRLRSGGFERRLLPRYRRRAADIDQTVLDMFLAGVSTRRVEEVLRPLMGERALSASTVSEISHQLDGPVELFHGRSLPDDYRYIVLDGIYLKAKSPISSRRRCILVAYGIRANGVRELIDYKLARKGESQAAWEGFLTSMRNRGLKGTHLRLVVVDGNKGLWNAIDLVWPDIGRQRCWAHKLRNVANKLPRKLQTACSNQARDIYTAEDRTQALRAFKAWARIWRSISPEAVRCLEDDLEDLLVFYDEPQGLWSKLRTTNAIERLFREVRRRTRPMSCFTNTLSVERIVYAVFSRYNGIWREKPLQITQKS